MNSPAINSRLASVIYFLLPVSLRPSPRGTGEDGTQPEPSVSHYHPEGRSFSVAFRISRMEDFSAESR